LIRDLYNFWPHRLKTLKFSSIYSGNIRSIADVLYKGALPLSIADAAAKSGSGVIALLIARYFGPIQFGYYATALSICGMCMLITGIGFEREFTRRGSVEKNDIPASLSLYLLSLAITSVAAYLMMIAFFSLTGYSRDITLIGLLLGVTLIAGNMGLPFRHLCVLLNKSHVTAIIQTIATSTVIALTVSAIYMKGSLLFIVVSQLLVAIGVAMAWFWWTPKSYFATRTTGRSVVDFFRDSAMFGFSNMIWVVYFNFDIFLMSLLRPDTEVGIYGGVYRVIAITYILGMAIANAFSPILFGKFASNRKEYARVCRNLVAMMSLIGLLLSVILFIYSGRVVVAILGVLYQEGAVIAKILSLAVMFRFLNFGIGEMLTTGNRQKARVSIEMVMLLTNVALNGLLIPLYGGVGAAVATGIAEIVLFIGAISLCFKYGLFEKGASPGTVNG
jgi:O-antigen/teichoic acid export membrane protein